MEIKSLRERTVVVTGAGGFIASHLVEELVRTGAHVRALVHYDSRGSIGWLEDSPPDVRARVRITPGDITSPWTLESLVEGADVVFHLAALIAIPYSFRDPSAYIQTNVAGTLNVLESSRRAGVRRIVHTSTSEVYGTAQYVPIDERHPICPQSPYAASKAAADHLALSYHAAFGTPVVVLRPFNTFGPRQSLRAVIPTIGAQLLAGRRVRLGDTRPTRDFTYVTDTVDGFIRAATAPEIEGVTLQLGTGREISVGDLALTMAQLLSVPLDIEVDPARVRPRASEVERLVSDSSLAAAKLGWRPQVTLEDGLRRTFEWLRTSALMSHAEEYVV